MTKEEYLKLEYKDWDGKTPVYSFIAKRYFKNIDEILDYCNKNNRESDDLQFAVLVALRTEITGIF